MKKSVYIIAFLLLFFASESALAQMNRKSIKKNNKRISSYRGKKEWFGKEKRYNTLGIALNALNYYGDLAPKPSQFSTDISFTRPAIGISFSHRFGPRYTVMGSFMYGTLKVRISESADANDLRMEYTDINEIYHLETESRNFRLLPVLICFQIWQPI